MMQKDHDVRQSKGSRIVDSKANKRSLADDVNMVSANLDAMEIGPVLLLERNREIQSGIESRAAMAVFALPGVMLQLPFESECPKGEWKAPRCAVLVSENPGMAQTCNVSMADE